MYLFRHSYHQFYGSRLNLIKLLFKAKVTSLAKRFSYCGNIYCMDCICFFLTPVLILLDTVLTSEMVLFNFTLGIVIEIFYFAKTALFKCLLVIGKFKQKSYFQLYEFSN